MFMFQHMEGLGMRILSSKPVWVAYQSATNEEKEREEKEKEEKKEEGEEEETSHNLTQGVPKVIRKELSSKMDS